MTAFPASALPRKLRQELGLEPARSKLNVDISDQGREDRTYKGVVYHSLMEKHYAQLLDRRVRHLDIVSWRRQVNYGDYVIDFELTHHNGTVELIEIKGHPTKAWKTKHRKFKREHPGLRYRVLTERSDGFFEEMEV